MADDNHLSRLTMGELLDLLRRLRRSPEDEEAVLKALKVLNDRVAKGDSALRSSAELALSAGFAFDETGIFVRRRRRRPPPPQRSPRFCQADDIRIRWWVRVVCRWKRQYGEDPPNSRTIVDPVREALARRNYDVLRKQITGIFSEPEFDQYRGPSHRPRKS
jgi:hypothetical protein